MYRRRSISACTQSPFECDPFQRGKKAGRNDPCPCGSGKKFKK
ncbi:SEC-C metal-binding domain-containing protein [Ammoniphilus sp. 3BR4]